MEKWKDSVFSEREELFERINELDEFQKSERFNELDEKQKALLVAQRYAMDTYDCILIQRLL
jgi:hypothetical protein